MTKKTPDEIRLTGLKLLAKMIVAVYLKQAHQVPDSELVIGEIEASCCDTGPANTADEKGS